MIQSDAKSVTVSRSIFAFSLFGMDRLSWLSIVGVLGCAGFIAAAPSRLPQSACPSVQALPLSVVSVTLRSALGFTEGLIWRQEGSSEASLLESTGSIGQPSTLNRIDIATGEVTELARTPKNAFGEGLTLFGEKLYQLTYTEGVGFVYNGSTFKIDEAFSLPVLQGWGLTHDARMLILSDGTDRISFADPVDLNRLRSIQVHDANGKAYSKLNELEYAGGLIYANIFQSDTLLQVDPSNGCVTGKADLSSLRRHFDTRDREEISLDPANNIANGIAYDPQEQSFYLTGKNWWKIFKVKLGPVA
jgi:glutamine cyclotransferase